MTQVDSNLKDLAHLCGAQLGPNTNGADAIRIRGLAPIDKAEQGELSFIGSDEYLKFATKTAASALILRAPLADCSAAQLIHPAPYVAFAKIAQKFFAYPALPKGISELAYVSEKTKIGNDVIISAFAYICEGAEIGDRVHIYPGVYVGHNAKIGEDSKLFPNACVYHGSILGKRVIMHANSVVGSDGFGYAVTPEESIKIPQVGIAVIEDDVEIGAVSTVDRAAMDKTVVGRGTKLDNHVQIAHNVRMGERCMLSSFSGIAGSSTLGDRITMGGHSAINGHIQVPSDTRLGAMGGIIKMSQEPGQDLLGFPSMPAQAWRKQQVYLKQLAELNKRCKTLEKKLSDLESRLS